ncbi:GSU3473 family protein [Desulfuromonas sp. DDH964]|jgi:hypothetical protein|uniref:GSU3473 family protein n=1 Tax=Desulfuromonas sp. DDH964 TaxID=1823759 RepID=UPI0018D452E0|nr:hypothetical protein [Desulfuromonas sp. DDH964]
MVIRIRYPDGRFDMVKATRLNTLIETEEIEGFKRASGWVVLGRDPVRGQGNDEFYHGTERRGTAATDVLSSSENFSKKLFPEAAGVL